MPALHPLPPGAYILYCLFVSLELLVHPLTAIDCNADARANTILCFVQIVHGGMTNFVLFIDWSTSIDSLG